MSMFLIVLGVLASLLTVVIYYFRTNAGMIFFAACASLLILSSVDPVVLSTAGSLLPTEGEGYVRLAVVALPIALAAMLFRHTVKGGALALHVAIGLLLAVVLALQLPGVVGLSWLLDTIDNDYRKLINDFSMLILALSFSLSLVAVMLSTKKSGKKSKH